MSDLIDRKALLKSLRMVGVATVLGFKVWAVEDVLRHVNEAPSIPAEVAKKLGVEPIREDK